MRGTRPNLNGTNGEIDENFWAEAAANQAADRNGEGEDGAFDRNDK
jgi:hypothetical protein